MVTVGIASPCLEGGIERRRSHTTDRPSHPPAAGSIRTMRALLLFLVAWVVGCSAESEDAPPSYYADVKPILDAKCGGCHVDDGIAPFTLGDYEAASRLAPLIGAAVSARTMPPWPPSDSCNEHGYVGDRSLSDEQIATVTGWVAAGAPEGDAAAEGAPLGATGGGLSRVDATVALPIAYTPRTQPDEYRCFVLDWPETRTRYVSGLGARPGDTRIVHHVIAYAAGPERLAEVDALDASDPDVGYPCFGGPGFARPQWIGAWVPGSGARDYPEGTGIAIEPGSKLVLQMHYNTSSTAPAPDRTELDLKLDDSVAKVARIQPWANPAWVDSESMEIAAGDADVHHAFSLDPTPLLTGGEAFTVYGAALHMHTLGTATALAIERADGARDCLVDIPRWDFHWQGMYLFAEPTVFQPGDAMEIACSWDNSAANQPSVGGKQQPPRDVFWGEGTSDEMCLGAFYMTSP
jgi:hypothetical protein